MMDNPMFGMGWGMWFIPLVIILVVYFLVRNNKDQSRSKNSLGSDSAMDILKKRYAKGEIARDEFEEMKKNI